MQIAIESTENLTTIDGVRCRVWHGTTAGGVPCILFIHRIAVAKDQDHAQFEAELAEQLPPGRHLPLSLIL